MSVSSSELPIRTVLVGRDAELGLLEAAVAAARAGGGSATIVIGEPGIGKTALVAATAERAHQEGALVLWGRCSALGDQMVWGPVSQALGALLDQGLLDASTASSCGGGLLAVLPEAIELSPELVAPTDADPETVAFSVARATTRLLRKVSLGRTCLLVIDDVHDADSASLRLLSRLAQEAGTMAVAILMTAREGELNASGNAEEVADLSRAVKSIHLGALDGAASRALVERVAPALPEEVLAQVLGAAVGNSLYLGELAALLKARSTMVEAELPIPVGVKASIRSRLDRLPTLARRFVDALAVLGGQAPIQRASEIAGVPASAAAPALDLGAIAISERRARVSHALVRDVAYGALSDEDRDRLHLR